MIDVRPVLIMAGGTGGHVFPALAVADELRLRGVPVVWLGTRAGIESRLVPQAGYPIEWMSITGLRGKSTFALLFAPVRLIMACWQALIVLLKRKPCAVLGMGGFASGPGGLMAWLMRKPLLVHEQNAIAGMTNSILARFANVVLQAFPGVFKNAVDWLSRPPQDQSRVFHHRPVGLMGATPGNFGTAFSQTAWLPTLRLLKLNVWFGDMLWVSQAMKVFDDQGQLVDDNVRKRLTTYMQGFFQFVRTLKADAG